MVPCLYSLISQSTFHCSRLLVTVLAQPRDKRLQGLITLLSEHFSFQLLMRLLNQLQSHPSQENPDQRCQSPLQTLGEAQDSWAKTRWTWPLMCPKTNPKCSPSRNSSLKPARGSPPPIPVLTAAKDWGGLLWAASWGSSWRQTLSAQKMNFPNGCNNQALWSFATLLCNRVAILFCWTPYYLWLWNYCYVKWLWNSCCCYLSTDNSCCASDVLLGLMKGFSLNVQWSLWCGVIVICIGKSLFSVLPPWITISTDPATSFVRISEE